MRKTSYMLAAALITAGFAAPGFLAAHQGATGIVKQRMDNFKHSQKQLKTVPQAVNKADYDAVRKTAEWLAEWAARMPEQFPEGSMNPPTEASPAIWQDFEDFTAKAEIFRQKSTALGIAARSGDASAVMSAFQEVAQSCSSCHKLYRIKSR